MNNTEYNVYTCTLHVWSRGELLELQCNSSVVPLQAWPVVDNVYRIVIVSVVRN